MRPLLNISFFARKKKHCWRNFKLTCHNCVRVVWILATLAGLVLTGYGLVWLHDHKYETHELAWFAAGMFVFLTVPISVWEIAEHLHHYSCPEEQKHIVRILWFVPIYAVDSYLAMIYKDLAIYINTGRECYEAFVIYSFVNFFVEAVGGETAIIQSLRTKDPHRVMHMFPFTWCFDTWEPVDFLAGVKNGTMSYVVLRLLTTAAALVMQWGGVYHEGELDATTGYFWCMMINCFSQTWALYCLVLVYYELHDELERVKPFGKFMSVKLIVFFSFWQSVAVALAVHFGVIKENPAWTEYTLEDVSTGLQDFMICIEMFLAAIAHKWVFSYKEYVNDETREQSCYEYVTNCIYMFDVSDVGEDAVHHVGDVIQGGVRVGGTGVHAVGNGVQMGVHAVGNGVHVVGTGVASGVSAVGHGVVDGVSVVGHGVADGIGLVAHGVKSGVDLVVVEPVGRLFGHQQSDQEVHVHEVSSQGQAMIQGTAARNSASRSDTSESMGESEGEGEHRPLI